MIPEVLRGNNGKVCTTVVVLALALGLLVSNRNRWDAAPEPFNVQDVVDKYDNCSVTFTPDTEQGNKKIIWSTGYPDAMPDSLIRSLVLGVTGIYRGAKSFYVQSKDARACRGSTVTVVCLLSRPETDFTSPDEHMQASDFSKEAIQLLRNPMTVFPAYVNDRYYDQYEGHDQIPADDWRRIRDTGLPDMMHVWMQNIKTWKSFPKTKIGLYLPFEYIMDPVKGPILVERMAELFEKEGYHTVLQSNARENMTCVWYKAVTRAHLVQYHSYGYEYSGYMPSYTPAQQSLLLEGLSNLTKAYAYDTELTSILQYYKSNILEHMVLDP